MISNSKSKAHLPLALKKCVSEERDVLSLGGLSQETVSCLKHRRVVVASLLTVIQKQFRFNSKKTLAYLIVPTVLLESRAERFGRLLLVQDGEMVQRHEAVVTTRSFGLTLNKDVAQFEFDR